MKGESLTNLSRRERQVMDIIYKNGEATVSEVLKLITEPPSYSTVRALMRVLEQKGYLKHREKGPRYVYSPTINLEKAKRSALKHLMQTFFDNSAERVIAAPMGISSAGLADEEFARMADLIEKSRKEGR